jgi:hypothetical protein
MMAEAGNALDRARGLVSPAQLAAFFSKGLDAQLAKLGAPRQVRERVGGVAREVAGELVMAAKEGRRPEGRELLEKAISTAAGAAVGEVFRPLEGLTAVKRNRILAGLVKEARATATDAATCGVLHAARLHEAMAKDPFWQTLVVRHGTEWRGFLTSNAMEAARQYVSGHMERHGASPVVQRAVELVTLGAERGIAAGMATWTRATKR